MHANVENHAGGAHPLTIQHAHTVSRIGQEPEFFHQTLSVERPAFTVSGNPDQLRAPFIHALTHDQRNSRLQMMPRNAFVVHRRSLTPCAKCIVALRNRPPHAPRARKIGGGAGVIDTALMGRGDAAFQTQHWAVKIKLGTCELVHRAVRERLHPLAERIGSVQGA